MDRNILWLVSHCDFSLDMSDEETWRRISGVFPVESGMQTGCGRLCAWDWEGRRGKDGEGESEAVCTQIHTVHIKRHVDSLTSIVYSGSW